MKIDFIIDDKTRCSGEIDGYIADKNPMKFDIMVDGYYRGQFTFPCTIGVEYSYNELKDFCKLKRPSLVDKDFELLPSGTPKFRN